MIPKLTTGALALTLTACTAVAPASAEKDVTEAGTGGVCNAAPAQGLAGRPGSAEVGAEALRLSGATSLRWIRPGDMMTMDYREDRLNIELDTSGRVTALRCG